MSQADSALGTRIDQVKATADAAAPMSALAGYVKTSDAQAAYATKAELSAQAAAAGTAYAPASLAQEVSKVKEVADAALPKDVASTTYATKEELTNAQLTGDGKIPDLSGYAKTSQLGNYATKACLLYTSPSPRDS